MMDIIPMTFEAPQRDYHKTEELRKKFMVELSALGFEESSGSGWGARIIGVVPTPNLDKVKQISGLIFSDE